jgi:small GTP-binding protein
LSISKEKYFSELYEEFLALNSEVEAIILSDQEGFIIAGEKRKSIDIELVSVLSTIVNPILDRFRDEFAFKKYGSASFDTEHNRLLFVSIDEDATLTLVLNIVASVDRLYPYAYYLAEKSAQIINIGEKEEIQIQIPNFEFEVEKSERLQHQIYQMRLDSGFSYRFKFVIIGDVKVGKTSIVHRFVDNKFSNDYRSTIGLDILSHTFQFIDNDIHINLWDIGAQQYFKRFRKTYYSGSQAAFIVFDLTNRKSFNNVESWYIELIDFIGGRDIPVILVGNKMDLVDQREIESQEGTSMAKYLSDIGISQCSFIETSALTGENIKDAFNLITYFYLQISKEREEDRNRDKLINPIKSILNKKKSLIITLLARTPFWNPVLQILTDLPKLGKMTTLKEQIDEKLYLYPGGLEIRSYTFDKFNIAGSDAVFCLFDARKTDHITIGWIELIHNIIKEIGMRKVILCGVRVSERTNWNALLDEFYGLNIYPYLEKNLISLFIFKVGIDYKVDIYEKLELMFNNLKEMF